MLKPTLENCSDNRAQPRRIQASDVVPVQADAAFINVIEALQQAHQSAFARSTETNNSSDLAWGDGQAHAPQHLG
jgi:hypothetical protein